MPKQPRNVLVYQIPFILRNKNNRKKNTNLKKYKEPFANNDLNIIPDNFKGKWKFVMPSDMTMRPDMTMPSLPEDASEEDKIEMEKNYNEMMEEYKKRMDIMSQIYIIFTGNTITMGNNNSSYQTSIIGDKDENGYYETNLIINEPEEGEKEREGDVKIKINDNNTLKIINVIYSTKTKINIVDNQLIMTDETDESEPPMVFIRDTESTTAANSTITAANSTTTAANSTTPAANSTTTAVKTSDNKKNSTIVLWSMITFIGILLVIGFLLLYYKKLRK